MRFSLFIFLLFPTVMSYGQSCSGTTQISFCDFVSIQDGLDGIPYSNNLDCAWLFAPDGGIPSITFTFFDVEGDNMAGTTFDFVAIYDGVDTNGQFLGSFDNDNPPSGTFTGFSGSLYLRFVTDEFVTREGWMVEYACQEACSAIVNTSLVCNEWLNTQSNLDGDIIMSVVDVYCSDFGLNTGPERFYGFTAPTDGEYIFELDNLGTADLELFVLEGLFVGPLVIEQNLCPNVDNCLGTSTLPAGSDERVPVFLTAGQTVVAAVDGFNGAIGLFNIRVTCGNDCADQAIPLVCGQTDFGNNFSTGNDWDIFDYGCAGLPTSVGFAGNDVVYEINHQGGPFSVSLFSDNNLDFDIFLFDDCSSGDANCFAASYLGVTSSGLNIDNIYYNNLDAGQYFVIVDAQFSTTSGNFRITYNCNQFLPSQDVLTCGTTMYNNRRSNGYTNSVANYCEQTGVAPGAGCTGPERVFVFFPPKTGEYTFTLTPNTPGQDFEMFLLDNLGGDDIGIYSTSASACIENPPTLGTTNEGEQIIAFLNERPPRSLARHEVYLVVDGFDGDEGEFTLTVECPDDCTSISKSFTSPYSSDAIDFVFEGNNPTDLTYYLYAEEIPDPDRPWLINNEEVDQFGRDITIDFTLLGGAGKFEVCYPDANAVNVDGEGFNPCAYTCDSFNIVVQPENLHGLVVCKDCICPGESGEDLPPPFYCQNFSERDDFDPLPHPIEGYLFDQNFVVQDEILAGAERLRLFRNLGGEINSGRYFLRLHTGLLGDNGISDRLRISFDASVESGNAQQRILLNRDVNEPIVIMDINWVDGLITLVGESGDFEVTFAEVNLFDATEARISFITQTQVPSTNSYVEVWVNGSYVGRSTEQFSQIDGLRFSEPFDGQSFNNFTEVSIDNICVRTSATDNNQCSDDLENPVCVDNGETYATECEAQQFGLYAVGEYGYCEDICDLSGPLITRGRGTGPPPISGQTFAGERVPNHAYTDDCVVDELTFELGAMPSVLYGDVYLFQNDDNPALSGDMDTGVFAYLYECQEDDSGDYAPRCLGSLRAGINEDLDPGGFYYILVVTIDPTSYTVNLTPGLVGCEYDSRGTFRANNPVEGFNPPLCDEEFSDTAVDFGDVVNFSSNNGYADCYLGFRQYDGAEVGYELVLDYPAFVSIDLDFTNTAGKGGIFVLGNLCADDCIGYADNQLFQTSVRLDSLPLGIGTYIIIVDQEATSPIGTFDLNICVARDVNNDNGFFVVTNQDGDCTDQFDPNLAHEVEIRPPGSQLDPDAQFVAAFNAADGGFRVPPNASRRLAGFQSVTLELPQQIPNFGNNFIQTCGFAPDSTIYLRRESPTSFTRLRSFGYASDSQNNSDKFVTNGRSVINNYEIDTTVSFQTILSAIALNSAGQPFVDNDIIISSGPYAVLEKSDWIRTETDIVNVTGVSSPGVSAEPLVGVEERVGFIRLAPLNTSDFSVTIVVYQYDFCRPIRFALNAQPQGCESELADVDLQLIDADPTFYNFRVNNVPVNYPLQVRTGQASTITIVANTDLLGGCNRDTTFTVNPITSTEPATPTYEEICMDDGTYTLNVFSAAELVNDPNLPGTLSSIGGGYQIRGISEGQDVTFRLRNGGCVRTFSRLAPDCTCAPNEIPLQPSVADVTLCADDPFPDLSVSLNAGEVADWRDAAGGLRARTTNEQPFWRPTLTGLYSVVVSQEDRPVCESVPTTFRINRRLPINITTPTRPVVCEGEEVTLTVSASAGAETLRFAWPGSAEGPTYSFNPDATGEGSVLLRISFVDGSCSESIQVPYEVVPEPALQLLSASCTDDPAKYDLVFTAAQTDKLEVFGDYDRLDTLNQSNGVVRIRLSGVVKDDNNALRITAETERPEVFCSDELLINPPDCECPSEGIPVSGIPQELYFCEASEGVTLDFPAAVDGFGWSLSLRGDESFSDRPSGRYLFTRPGVYELRVETVSSGCLATNPYVIIVNELSLINLDVSATPIVCSGERVTVTVNATSDDEGTVVLRSNGNVLLNNQYDLVPQGTGWQSVAFEATYNEVDCPTVDTARYYVIPEPEFSYDPSQDFCGEDPSDYTIRFQAFADEVQVDDVRLTPTTDNQYVVTGIPEGDSIRVSLTNAFGGMVSCSLDTLIAAPDCSCPSDELDFSLPDTLYQFCSREDFSGIDLPEIPVGFRLLIEAPDDTEVLQTSSTYIPQQTGRYRLRLQSDMGACVSRQSQYFTVELFTPLTGALTFSDTVCLDGDVLIDANELTGNGELTHTWAAQGELSNFEGERVRFFADAVGAFSVFLNTVDNGSGCTYQDTAVIVVLDKPIATFEQTADTDPETGGTGSITVSVVGGTAPYTFLWNRNGSLISENDTMLDSLNAADVYQFTITDANGCHFTSPDIDIDLRVSTTQPAVDAGIRVFPNPTDGLLYIDAQDFSGRVSSIRLFNVTGKEVFFLNTTGLSANQWSLSLTQLPAGTYLLSATGQDGRSYTHLLTKI